MKILVLDDDYAILRGAFEYLNIKYHNSQLDIQPFSKTQEVDLGTVDTFEKIFVDISLHRSSSQDGYSFIKTLLEQGVDKKKIVIITGSDKVKEKLREFDLPQLPILLKPLTFNDLNSVL